MKLIVDIPEDRYKQIKDMPNAFGSDICKAVRNGTPYEERPQGKCRTCRHRDPEDKKCDCGEPERAGCPFPVRDNYFCKFYEKGGAE